MPASMARTYCHSCDVDYFANHHWLHCQSKTHRRNVNERFPLPPSPWRTAPELNLPAPTLPHLTYLNKTSK